MTEEVKRLTPELVDELAWHAVFKRPGDPKSKLAELRDYEAAKRNGFACYREGEDAHLEHYYSWCCAANRPYIRARLSGKYARVDYNADTTGDPYTCNPGVGFGEKFCELVEPFLVAPDANVCPGEHHLSAYGMTPENAVMIAERLWEWARPFCIPSEVRERWHRKVWLERRPVELDPPAKPWQVTIDLDAGSQLVLRIRTHTRASVAFTVAAAMHCGGVAARDKDGYITHCFDEPNLVDAAREIAQMSEVVPAEA